MTVPGTTDSTLLLEAAEVPPVLEQNPGGRSSFVLTCDHYGKLLPRALGDLGLPAAELERHIGWDIGIAGVAEPGARCASGGAALFAPCHRLQPAALGAEFDPDDQRAHHHPWQ